MGAKGKNSKFLRDLKGALLSYKRILRENPNDVEAMNQLGVVYLTAGNANDKALRVYHQALVIDPEDGFANMHYGFCLKFNEKYEEAIPYLRKGVESGAEGTQAGKFYSFLGDALIRTNRNAE